MALTLSTMMNLGSKAPDFNLKDTITETLMNFGDCRGPKGTVVVFICNHCPYVIHIMPELIKIINEYTPQGIGFVAISSNDIVNYPQDGPDKMKEFASKWKLNAPYLFDYTQGVAKAYDAACTPDFYVFSEADKLIYRGRLDESRPREDNPKPLTGKDLRAALNAHLANQMVSEIQFPSMGCNIKWK